MTIAREGRARRMEVERELVSMEENLKTKLTALAGQKNSDRTAILPERATSLREGTMHRF